MPLLDHFRPPVSTRKSWETVHNGWAFVISQRLNRAILTDRYESESVTHHGARIEIDIATYEDDSAPPAFGAPGANGHGGVAIAAPAYAPPAPALACEVAIADADTFEVNVYKQDGGWKLVAAVELVSPANKDRSSHRRAFATKVASYLQQGVCVVSVDVVTDRTANLHEDVSAALHLPDALDWSSPTGLSAICYRLVRIDGKERLEMWPHELALGAELPTLPLWLEPNLAVPLELELTYAETCSSFRLTAGT